MCELVSPSVAGALTIVNLPPLSVLGETGDNYYFLMKKG